MFVTGRIARVAAATVSALLVAAGCTSGDDPAPEPTGLIAATTMRGALLQANEIGPTWQPPQTTPDPNRMVSMCGGTSTPPALPPGAEVVAASFADEGSKGAQTLDQTALVYPDESAAAADQAGLLGVAEGCPPNVSVPATVTDDKSEPAYTETVQIQTLTEGAWSGFAALRHKVYEPKHPGTADIAVVVLHSRNVVLIEAYALYLLNNPSAAPNFTADWQRLVGSVVQRAG